MSDIETIKVVLNGHDIGLLAEPLQDPEVPSTYILHLEIARNESGHQRPSKRLLSEISELLTRKGILVKFILSEQGDLEVTATVKTVLDRRYSNFVRNVFVNLSADQKIVWIEPKQQIDPDTEGGIKKVVLDVLNSMGVGGYMVEFTTTVSLPTPTAVLARIRMRAPISKKRLIQVLIEDRFDIPNEDWIDRMLDRLRRGDLILRKKEDQSFVLTKKGLISLGSTKTRRSPDVVRALALARGTL